MTQPNKCCGCSEAINTDSDDYGWSTTKSDYLCAVCRDMDESSSSVMMVTTNGQTAKYFIGEHLRVDENGEEMSEPDWLITRQWVKSDDHRGFNDTLVDGWTTVLEGWTTGNWDDPTGQRKRKFNEWAESVHDGEIIPPVQIAIIADPTSNIFSTGISVLTPDPIGFKEWLGSELSELQNSLL